MRFTEHSLEEQCGGESETGCYFISSGKSTGTQMRDMAVRVERMDVKGAYSYSGVQYLNF